MACMKNAKAFLIASLWAAMLSPAIAGLAQSLPNAPAPAPPPDPAWDRVRNLAPGVPIVVRSDNAPPAHCLFAGATDAYLFCNPQGNPPGVGYRFDRASVQSVDLDAPAQNGARFEQPERNYHPAWLASMIGGGLIVGIIATQTTDAGDAARAGAIGALVVGAIGAPLAFLPRPQEDGFAYNTRGFAIGRIPLPGWHANPVFRLAHLR